MGDDLRVCGANRSVQITYRSVFCLVFIVIFTVTTGSAETPAEAQTIPSQNPSSPFGSGSISTRVFDESATNSTANDLVDPNPFASTSGDGSSSSNPPVEASPFSSIQPQTSNRSESILNVIGQSLIGTLRSDRWRPLGIGSFFSEGWDEPYAPVPSTDGTSRIAPRQPWVNSDDGAFYRLFLFSFGYARGLPGNTNEYTGIFGMFTPFSRRFEIGWGVPFVQSAPNALGTGPTDYWTGAGDLTIIPRFLLAEDKRYTISTNLFVRVPTGNARIGNNVTSLSPDIEFWANPFTGWVVRGGLGVTEPTNLSASKIALLDKSPPWTGFYGSPGPFSSFDARFAVGKYLRPSDAKIMPNLCVDVAANLHTAISGGNYTYFSLTPGILFGLRNNWVFRAGIEVPMVGITPFQTQSFFQIIKPF